MIHYPEVVDTIDSAKRLVAIINGSSPRDLKTALKDGWVVQGYLQSFLGDPTVSALSVDSADMPANIDDAWAFEQIVKIAEYEPKAVHATALSGILGGSTIITLLLPILTKWLVNWLQNGGLEEIINRIRKEQPA